MSRFVPRYSGVSKQRSTRSSSRQVEGTYKAFNGKDLTPLGSIDVENVRHPACKLSQDAKATGFGVFKLGSDRSRHGFETRDGYCDTCRKTFMTPKSSTKKGEQRTEWSGSE